MQTGFLPSHDNLGPRRRCGGSGREFRSGAGSSSAVRRAREAGGQWALGAAGCPLATPGLHLQPGVQVQGTSQQARAWASRVSLLHLGAYLKSKARPAEAVVTKAVAAKSEGSPAGHGLEEHPPRALAGLLLFKAQVQEMDVVVGRKETFRPLYWDRQSNCIVAA